MAISFVNGFLCTSSCDVSKAKRGVDPHPKPEDVQGSAKPEVKNGVVTSDNAAVVFGGSLSATSAATNVAASSAVQSSVPANAQVQGQIVNLIV
jgi:hypothetical protein